MRAVRWFGGDSTSPHLHLNSVQLRHINRKSRAAFKLQLNLLRQTANEGSPPELLAEDRVKWQ